MAADRRKGSVRATGPDICANSCEYIQSPLHNAENDRSGIGVKMRDKCNPSYRYSESTTFMQRNSLKTQMIRGLMVLAVVFFAVPDLRATLFFTDQFNYADNSILGSTTGPWNT